MIAVNFQDNPELYLDHEACLEFLRSIHESDFEYPDTVTTFHVYSEVRSPKELMAVKSYLATQSPEHTRMIVWSDYDISDNPLLAPYRELVDMRVYDPIAEAEGTLLEGREDYLRSTDSNHWMNSGVLRFLVTNKYRGIYIDMDMILLRDFKPILDQDFAYMWGSSTDFAREDPESFGPCAAMIGVSRSEEYSRICMEELVTTEIVPMTTCFDHELLAKVYRRCPHFTIFPSVFFDTEWQINVKYPGLGTAIENGWFSPNEFSESGLFTEAFAWHWHNSNYRSAAALPGSKFGLLEKLTDRRLKERGIL